jgi:hypothetical protein
MKIKKHKLNIRNIFPEEHSKAGKETFYAHKIIGIVSGIKQTNNYGEKIHVVEQNYDYWKKRIDMVNCGDAVLDLYCYFGDDFRKFHTFDKNSGLDIQKLGFFKNSNLPFVSITTTSHGGRAMSATLREIDINQLAENNGLSLQDFQEWLNISDCSKPLAIIHFTKFRY